MIWMPKRPGSQDAELWLDQLRDDSGWEQDGGWDAGERGEQDGHRNVTERSGAGRGWAAGGGWEPDAAGDPEPYGQPWPGAQGESALGRQGESRLDRHSESGLDWPEATGSPPVSSWQDGRWTSAGQEPTALPGNWAPPPAPQPSPPAQPRQAPGRDALLAVPDPSWPSAASAISRAASALVRPVPVTERPVIGDELRLPEVWCQRTPCIARHADAEALGEADARGRAIAAGWREDSLGRLVCPDCQRGDTYFWTTQPVVHWDREVAVTMTSLIAAAISKDAVGAAGAETGVLPAVPTVPSPAGREDRAPAAEAAWTGTRDGWPPGEEPAADLPAGSGRHRRRR